MIRDTITITCISGKLIHKLSCPWSPCFLKIEQLAHCHTTRVSQCIMPLTRYHLSSGVLCKLVFDALAPEVIAKDIESVQENFIRI